MTLGNGKPCKRCGTSEWYKSGGCKKCTKEQALRWYEKNPERAARNKRGWRSRNVRERRERKRKWRSENRDKVSGYNRRFRANNPEKAAESCRRWQKANPDKVAEKSRRRRARKNRASGSHTAGEWKALVKHQDGRCLACGKKKKLTADHVVPLSVGGSDDISNIQGLCKPCNSSKGAKATDYRKGNRLIRWIQRKML